jgi:hypothetical protein
MRKSSFKLIAIKIVCCAALLLAITAGQAQIFNGSGGSVGVSYTLLPNRSFKDTSGQFGYNTIAGHVTIPLFGNRNKIKEALTSGDKPSDLHFYQTSLHASFGSSPFTIGFVGDPHHFYNGSVSMGAMFFTEKNIFIANLGIGMAADDQVIKNNNTRYRFSGSFMVANKHSKTTTYYYGLAYTYTYGRGLPLPVLGIHTKLGDDSKWSLSGILPLSLQLHYALDKSWRLGYYLRPAGDRYQFTNSNELPSASPYVFMQVRQFQTGASFRCKINPLFTLEGDAGVLFGGNIRFSEYNDRKNYITEAKIKPGPSLKLSLVYRFSGGHHANEEEMLGGLSQ